MEIMVVLLVANTLSLVVHECAHALAAMVCGMRVTRIALYRELWGLGLRWRVGGTRFSIGLVPVGGEIKFAGMPEWMDPLPDAASVGTALTTAAAGRAKVSVTLNPDVLRSLAPERPEPWHFAQKSATQQMAVMAAGAGANLLCFVAIAAGLLVGALPSTPFWLLFAALNLVDGVWNALPMRHHDGYWIRHILRRTRNA